MAGGTQTRLEKVCDSASASKQAGWLVSTTVTGTHVPTAAADGVEIGAGAYVSCNKTSEDDGRGSRETGILGRAVERGTGASLRAHVLAAGRHTMAGEVGRWVAEGMVTVTNFKGWYQGFDSPCQDLPCRLEA